MPLEMAPSLSFDFLISIALVFRKSVIAQFPSPLRGMRIREEAMRVQMGLE